MVEALQAPPGSCQLLRDFVQFCSQSLHEQVPFEKEYEPHKGRNLNGLVCNPPRAS